MSPQLPPPAQVGAPSSASIPTSRVSPPKPSGSKSNPDYLRRKLRTALQSFHAFLKYQPDSFRAFLASRNPSTISEQFSRSEWRAAHAELRYKFEQVDPAASQEIKAIEDRLMKAMSADELANIKRWRTAAFQRPSALLIQAKNEMCEERRAAWAVVLARLPKDAHGMLQFNEAHEAMTEKHALLVGQCTLALDAATSAGQALVTAVAVGRSDLWAPRGSLVRQELWDRVGVAHAELWRLQRVARQETQRLRQFVDAVTGTDGR